MIPGSSLHGSHIAVPCCILQHWRSAMKIFSTSIPKSLQVEMGRPRCTPPLAAAEPKAAGVPWLY